MRHIPFVAASLVALTAGCARSAVIPPRETAPRVDSAVAIVADSPEALRNRSAEALKQGLQPRYLSVRVNSEDYPFTVYAQVVRTEQALIIRGFGRIYVFDPSRARIHYTGLSRDLAISDIPIVTSARIDDVIALPETKQRTDARARAKCPDCLLVVGNPNQLRSLSAPWAGTKDPWQTKPDYTVVYGGQPSATRSPLGWFPCGIWPGQAIRTSSSGWCDYGSSSIGSIVGGSFSFARLPRARYNTTAEAACRTQGGRYADYWDPTGGNFHCQHVTDAKPLISIGGYVNSVCLISSTLPAFAQGPIIVNMTGDSLTPSGTTLAVGVRADLLRCSWFPGN